MRSGSSSWSCPGTPPPRRSLTSAAPPTRSPTSSSLPAEIQRRLLPASYTCEAGQFTLAGWLEPASSVGGDTFDYTLDRDSLQVSITDAVGHQVSAALLATLLVGSLRNGRRKGLPLEEQARYAND